MFKIWLCLFQFFGFFSLNLVFCVILNDCYSVALYGKRHQHVRYFVSVVGCFNITYFNKKIYRYVKCGLIGAVHDIYIYIHEHAPSHRPRQLLNETLTLYLYLNQYALKSPNLLRCLVALRSQR